MSMGAVLRWIGIGAAVAAAVTLLVVAPGGMAPSPQSNDEAFGTSTVAVPRTTPATDHPSTTIPTTTGPQTTSLTVDLPEAGPIFGEETGVLLLFDDGYDGLTAFDPDRRLVARSLVEGQRPGDEPYSMIRAGDSLVVGWGEPHAFDISSREAMSLGVATVFVPAAEPNRVWLIDYGNRIGDHTPRVWQVDVASGETVSDPVEVTGGYPEIGIPGGLAIQTDTGLKLWFADTQQTVALDSDDASMALDVFGDHLVWCSGYCTELRVADTSTLATEFYPAPSGHDRFLSGRFSPSGRHLAVLVGGLDVYEGEALWLLDRETGDITVIGDPDSHVEFVAWSPDGGQVFATSSGSRITVVWRYHLANQVLTAVVLPFWGALRPVVVDASVAGAYFGEVLVDPSECRAPGSFPSRRSGICTFGL
jgi:hypothetical protein